MPFGTYCGFRIPISKHTRVCSEFRFSIAPVLSPYLRCAICSRNFDCQHRSLGIVNIAGNGFIAVVFRDIYTKLNTLTKYLFFRPLVLHQQLFGLPYQMDSCILRLYTAVVYIGILIAVPVE